MVFVCEFLDCFDRLNLYSNFMKQNLSCKIYSNKISKLLFSQYDSRLLYNVFQGNILCAYNKTKKNFVLNDSILMKNFSKIELIAISLNNKIYRKYELEKILKETEKQSHIKILSFLVYNLLILMKTSFFYQNLNNNNKIL